MDDSTAEVRRTDRPLPHDPESPPVNGSAHDSRELRALARLSTLGALGSSEHDPEQLIQRLTDEAMALVGGQFGVFLSNTTDEAETSYLPHATSGAPRAAVAQWTAPRNAPLFAATLAGDGVIRSADLSEDPRYELSQGALPIRSFLAVPVKSVTEGILGGLFVGHSQPRAFNEVDERALAALASIAGNAVTNARLVAKLAALEAELASTQARYRLVSEATQEGLWVWDVGADTVEWNDQLLQKMGVTRAEWGGRYEDWFARLHPDDQPRLAAALKAHLERRVPYRVEHFRLRHADGAYRWCTTFGQAHWDEHGRPLRMAGSFRDVTERKLAEDRLRDNEHRSAQILDSVQDMVFTKNEHLEITWANAAACCYFGATLDQLRARGDLPFEDPELLQQFQQDDQKVFETGLAVNRSEESAVSLQGERRTFHTVKTPIKDTTGRVIELVGVARDVTDQKREHDAQQLLADASAQLGASIDYETTLANVARSTVPTFADWSAVDILDHEGQPRRLAVHHSDPTKIALAHELHRRYPPNMQAQRGLAQVLRTKRVEYLAEISDEMLQASAVDAEHLARLRSLGLGSYVVAPIVIQGQAVGAISFVSAESKRRYTAADAAFAGELGRRAAVAIENARLYRQVSDFAATLERRVEQRTAALLEANQELESFSYTVSHDLRAPVRHIGGFADLLRASLGDNPDEKVLRYLDTIKGAATQMGTLIDGLLNFSRLGRAELQKRPVELAALVQSVLTELGPDIADRRIRFSVGRLPTASVDATMLRLVLSNLIGNAAKYTRQRDPAHIQIGGRRELREIVIWVKDDGVGFDMAYVHKLFGVFQRLHSDVEFEGTGIGLATVRRVINRHGGRTWAEGTLGGGASFYFSLPIEETLP